MNTKAPAPNPSAPPFPGVRTLGGRFASGQHGALIPLFAIALVPMLAIVGLALDMGHLYWNRTRLQNAVDAAALHAARMLDDKGNSATLQGAAFAEAANTFSDNTGYTSDNPDGNEELSNSGTNGDIPWAYLDPNSEQNQDPNPNNPHGVEFSDSLPFTPGGNNPRFVRVTIPSFKSPYWLLQVLSIIDPSILNDPNINTGKISAVAGPSPTLSCPANIVPLVACDNPIPRLFPQSSATTPLAVVLAGRGSIAAGYTSDLCVNDAQISVTSIDNSTLRSQLTTRIANDNAYTVQNRTYAQYRSQVTNAGPVDQHSRIVTLPLVLCPPGNVIAPGSQVTITGFGCFYLRNSAASCTNSMPMSLESNCIQSVASCLNQGTGIQAGTAVGNGPHTIILYKE